MRGFRAAVAVLAVILAMPVLGQRGGGRGGGFAGRAAAAHTMSSFAGSRGSGRGGRGFSGGVTRVSGGMARVSGGRPGGGAGRATVMLSGVRRAGSIGQGDRRRGEEDGRFRRPYLSPYRLRSSYLFPGALGLYDPGLYDSGLDDAGATGFLEGSMGDAAGTAPAGGGGEPVMSGDQAGPGPAPLPPRPFPVAPEQGRQQGSWRVQEQPLTEEAVVLVFRDGRAPETIRNYMLTPTTLYVQDGRGSEIPIEEIDLQATERLNHDVGVEFRPPEATR